MEHELQARIKLERPGIQTVNGSDRKTEFEVFAQLAMSQDAYPRSPKALLGGFAHLRRFIDKIRLRNAGKIQDYNYMTVGFDKHLIDFLRIDPKAFEQRVLAGGADHDFLAWVMDHGVSLTQGEIAQWNEKLLSAGPADDAALQRFQGRLQDIARKRKVAVSALPSVSTWADLIELDEERL
jgi:hypothetical protein